VNDKRHILDRDYRSGAVTSKSTGEAAVDREMFGETPRLNERSRLGHSATIVVYSSLSISAMFAPTSTSGTIKPSGAETNSVTPGPLPRIGLSPDATTPTVSAPSR
jgi:hypothetical protein